MNKTDMVSAFEVSQHSQEIGSKEGDNKINIKLRIMKNQRKKGHALLKQDNRVGQNGVGKPHLSIVREDLSEAEIFLLRPRECKGQPGSRLGEETSDFCLPGD